MVRLAPRRSSVDGFSEGRVGVLVAGLVEVLHVIPAAVHVYVADHLLVPLASPELDPLLAVHALGHRAGLDQSGDRTAFPLRLCRGFCNTRIWEGRWRFVVWGDGVVLDSLWEHGVDAVFVFEVVGVVGEVVLETGAV